MMTPIFVDSFTAMIGNFCFKTLLHRFQGYGFLETHKLGKTCQVNECKRRISSMLSVMIMRGV